MKTTFAFVFLFFLAACQGLPEGDADAARTAAAQTLDAQLGVAQAEAAIRTAEAEQSVLETELAILETENAQLEIELEQTQSAQQTFSAIQPKLIAPSGAICRVGPNPGFVRVADVEAGDSIQVVGRSDDGEWWLAELDDGSECWVFWSSELGFEGDVFSLPLVQGPSLPTNTPSPTRAPGFSINYVGSNTCEGSHVGVFEIRNTGPETYESIRIGVADVASSTQLRSSDGNNEFLGSSGACPKGASTLGPGQSAFIVIGLGNSSDGDLLRISVRLCTENGLGGTCISGNRQFTR